MLDAFVQQLMKDMDIKESLATEVPGVYAIPVDENTTAVAATIPRGFSLRCDIGPINPENEDLFFSHALQANLFGQGTEGNILGLDGEGKKLILSREIDYNIEYKEFRDIIEDFLNSVDFWREEAQAYGTKIE